MLELADDELIEAIGGRRRELLRDELSRGRRRRGRASARTPRPVELVCRCDPAYPRRLRELAAAAGGAARVGRRRALAALASEDPVAVVGARAASPYGAAVARSLARGLTRAGVVVLSGMAQRDRLRRPRRGARRRRRRRLRCCPGRADRPYPPGRRALHRRLTATGAAVSELPPGATGAALDVPGPQPDHRRAGGDDRRGRGRRALRRAADRRLRGRAGPAGRRRARPGHRAAGRRAQRAARRRSDRRPRTPRTCSTPCSAPEPGCALAPTSARSSTPSSRRLLDAIGGRPRHRGGAGPGRAVRPTRAGRARLAGAGGLRAARAREVRYARDPVT